MEKDLIICLFVIFFIMAFWAFILTWQQIGFLKKDCEKFQKMHIEFEINKKYWNKDR